MATEQIVSTRQLTGSKNASSAQAPIVRRPGPAKAGLRADVLERTRKREEFRTRPHVIDEFLFATVLAREIRRAERSNLPAAVAVVATKAGYDGPLLWRPIVAALNAAKRETDVIGWMKKQSGVAIILPEIRTSEGDPVAAFESRVRSELSQRLDAHARQAVSISVHVTPNTVAQRRSRSSHTDAASLFAALPTSRTLYDTLKRALDVIGSAALLVLLAPVFVVITALIKLTSEGPVFFRQQRVGEKGKPFTMLKFRTMKVNNDPALHQKFVTDFIKANGSGAKSQGPTTAPFKIVNDPRVTSIGRILRKTSLDELPQFWNVLVGDMSLVGPRPPIAYEVEQYKFWHNRRLFEAKPGVTGLWQVSGRSRTTFDEMVRLDLRYAKSRSIWNDVKILLATPGAVFTGKGAC